ncbi:DUF454 domain-containing protein [Coprobacillus sp. OF03-2AA]|nr:DUF454 domain-containing protein [Coprobacillus sp. OF03-2AA]
MTNYRRKHENIIYYIWNYIIYFRSDWCGFTILPTTPFLLLSAFLFSKSSDRFHEYLIQTKLYQKYINEMVIERKTTRKKRNQSLFTVTLIFLIAVMITPVWIGKICLLMVMSIHHFIMLKKVEIINE